MTDISGQPMPMNLPPLGAEDVAQYLRVHPEFFESHADLLASITVPHPHGGRAISLQERQLDVLRERHRLLEVRLAELMRIGQENDAITDKLQRWTRQLLLVADAEKLPQALLEGMQRILGWDPIMDDGRIIGLVEPTGQGAISLEPGGQFELSGAPLETIHQT